MIKCGHSFPKELIATWTKSRTTNTMNKSYTYLLDKSLFSMRSKDVSKYFIKWNILSDCACSCRCCLRDGVVGLLLLSTGGGSLGQPLQTNQGCNCRVNVIVTKGAAKAHGRTRGYQNRDNACRHNQLYNPHGAVKSDTVGRVYQLLTQTKNCCNAHAHCKGNRGQDTQSVVCNLTIELVLALKKRTT